MDLELDKNTDIKSAKVLLFTVRSDLSGGPKHVSDLVAYLKGHKEIKLYIACPADEPFGEPMRRACVAWQDIPARKFSILKLLSLVVWAKKNNIQVVHSHGRGAGIYSRLMKLFGFKIVHTFHGIHTGDKIFDKIKLGVDKLLVKLTDYFIFTSDDECSKAKSLGQISELERFSIVENGVQVIEPREAPRNLRKIAVVARNDYVKGIDILSQYSEEFCKSHSNLNIIFEVAGVREDEIKSPHENLKFVGKKFPITPFLKTCDLFLSCSRSEGLPLTVLEAIAAGIPCLLSKVPGHNYFINKDLAEGFVLNSYQDFSEKLLSIIANPPKQDELDLRHNYVLKNHSLESVADKIKKIYLSI